MKKNLFPRLLCAFGLLFGQSLSAADYVFIGPKDDIPWDKRATGDWENPPGIPPAGGPTENDNLDLNVNSTLNVRRNNEDFGIPRVYSVFIHNLSSSVSGAAISAFNNYTSTLTVRNDINITTTGATLKIYNRNSSSRLIVNVENNVNVGSGNTLYLGGEGSAGNGKLEQFTVAGSTNVSGTLLNFYNNTDSTIHLGDLVLNEDGSLIASAKINAGNSGSASLDTTISARSLTGTGSVIGSDVSNTGTRNITLSISTKTTTDATYGGVLSDATGSTTGTNKLHLSLSGSGAQTLTGVNTYTGNTMLTGGTLILDGAGSINSSAAITLNGGSLIQNSSTELTASLDWQAGTIGGNGVIDNNLNAAGSGAKFLAPGSLTGEGIGKLSVNGDINLDEETTLKLTLGGTGAGLFDSLEVDGILNLNHAVLAIDLVHGANVGDEFAIATFGTLGTSTFHDLADGASFDVGLTTFVIHYGDHDITLQVAAIPEPGSLTLFGFSTLILASALLRRKRHNLKQGV